MGFIEQLVALLQREQDGTHEHLLSALLALVEDYQRAILECRRPEFLLKELLENRLENIKDRDDFKVSKIRFKFHAHLSRYYFFCSLMSMIVNQIVTVDYSRCFFSFVFLCNRKKPNTVFIFCRQFSMESRSKIGRSTRLIKLMDVLIVLLMYEISARKRGVGGQKKTIIDSCAFSNLFQLDSFLTDSVIVLLSGI